MPPHKRRQYFWHWLPWWAFGRLPAWRPVRWGLNKNPLFRDDALALCGRPLCLGVGLTDEHVPRTH